MLPKLPSVKIWSCRNPGYLGCVTYELVGCYRWDKYKHEWTNHETFASLEEARLSVFKYIETFYNPKRLHQTLGYLSPDQYEAEHAPAAAA